MSKKRSYKKTSFIGAEKTKFGVFKEKTILDLAVGAGGKALENAPIPSPRRSMLYTLQIMAEMNL